MSGVIAVPVSDDIRSYVSLNGIDYAGAVRMEVPDSDVRGAEERLREIFESIPAPARIGLRLAWRIISLRLGPYPSPEHVLGWTIEDSQPRCARIATDGWLGIRTNLVLRLDGTALTFATLIEYRRPAARLMWLFVRPIHLVIVRLLVSRTGALRP